jgi:sodium transport system permease protein
MIPRWRTIFKKEFGEIFRDPRTRFGTIVSPLIISPLILILVGGMTRKQVEDRRTEIIKVAVVGKENAPSVYPLLAKIPQMTLTPMEKTAAGNAIHAREIQAAVVLPADTEASLAAQKPTDITIVFDAGYEASRDAADRVEAAFSETIGPKIVTIRLKEKSLAPEIITPFTLKQTPLPGGAGAGVLMLAMFLPYILSLSAIMGGTQLANDTVAGEKERGTLETLLASPVSRRDIVIGKFLAVACVSLVNSMLSIVGMLWPLWFKLSLFGEAASTLKLGVGAIIAMGLVQIPLAILGTGILMTISTFARNQKEASTYLLPTILCVSVGAICSMLLPATAPLYWAFIPITNAALVLKQALQGLLNIPFVAIACGTSLLYAVIAIWVAIQAFQKESILLKS